MNCPACTKEVVADRLFCTWCESYLPDVNVGSKAGLFRRWFAAAIDPALIALAIMVPPGFMVGMLGDSAGGSLAVLAVVVMVGAVIVLFFKLFARGMTPGKYVLGEQVVDKLNGGNPGFLKMLIRETFGKFLSALVFGLGYFWAIWDKDSQAWHDKIAGTVVVKRRPAGVRREVEVPLETIRT